MAPRVKKAGKAAKGAKFVDPVKAKTKAVAEALEEIEDLPERVQAILSETLAVSLGQQKATRHPFNDRLVQMTGTVLEGHHQALQKTVADKQKAFDDLAPAKGVRETALEQAKADESLMTENFANAKVAVAENNVSVKQAVEEIESKTQAQAAGDEELAAISDKKDGLAQAHSNSLKPLLDGSVALEERTEKIAAVLKAGKSFSFDASLMQAVVQVLEKPKEERTGFDATCTEQIEVAFTDALQKFEDQLAAGDPAKAERQAAVEQAEAARQQAETRQTELVQEMTAAKEAKEAATVATKTAQRSLTEFIPEVKTAGDELDEAKECLEEFTAGALAAFNDLKDWKEGDFAPPPVTSGEGYYETIDGMSCDRGIVDACRTAVAGTGDGRVSVEDAKQVFEKVADGGKETQKERWTMRYCMQEFKWTDAAHDWIVEELTKVNQEGLQGSPAKKARGDSYYEVIDSFKCDRGIIDACRESVAGQGDGRISKEDAEKVWAKAADGNKVTQAERWTLRYCFSSFNWTRAAHDWLIEQLSQETA